ncbi:MAG TPA: ABC transporter permease [Gemmatimonadales bacterium]|nr:ABC transporter permease [Gemmatimonadales bacterium]
MALFSFQDARLALRSLQSRPGFSVVVIATLALGIGTTTAMFSLVDAALLRALPFAEPDRLMVLWGVSGPERSIRGASIPEVADWRSLNRTLTDVSVWDPISLNLRTESGPLRIQAERVNAGYFELLGTPAELGRTFTAEEDKVADAVPVAVVSHAFWKSRLASDPAVIGRTIALNDRSFSVIGVMPEGFGGLSFQADVWVPVAMISVDNPVRLLTSRDSRWLGAVGRLKPGISRAAAQRDVERVATGLAERFPETNRERSVDLLSLKQNFLGTTAALFAALFKAVLLVLLIACVNVMSLQLVRANAREREIALRLALGGGGWPLTRQLLTEGLVLAGLGGIAGILVAHWSIRLLAPLAPAGVLPPYAQLGVDTRVMLFSLGITLICGVACGLTPLLRRNRSDLAGALREGARAASSGLGRLRHPGLQQAFVVAEVALALMLLAGAGLMLRSLRERLAVAPGFDASPVVAARFSLPRTSYAGAARVVFAERLAERLSGLPGVSAASVATDLPLRGTSNAATLLVDQPGAEPIRFFRHGITPGFFATLGIPIVAGRGVSADDRPESPRVAVISLAMARRYWGGTAAIGHRFRLRDAGGPEVLIVGIAGSARFRSLTSDPNDPSSEPDVYFPIGQRPDSDLEIAVRSRSGSTVSATQLQQEVSGLDGTLPIYAVEPLEAAQNRQNAAPRFGSLLLSVFSALALGLAAIGVYGVIAFVVGLSTREIAIRLALGADRAKVQRVVIGNGMILVAIGVGLGMLGARLGGRVLESQLYGIHAGDPATLGAVTLTVLLVALLASWLPARRAAAIQPQVVLKEQ